MRGVVLSEEGNNPKPDAKPIGQNPRSHRLRIGVVDLASGIVTLENGV